MSHRQRYWFAIDLDLLVTCTASPRHPVSVVSRAPSVPTVGAHHFGSPCRRPASTEIRSAGPACVQAGVALWLSHLIWDERAQRKRGSNGTTHAGRADAAPVQDLARGRVPGGCEADDRRQGHPAHHDPAAKPQGRGTELEGRRYHSATDAPGQREAAGSARSPDGHLHARSGDRVIVSEPDHGAKAVRLLLSVARTPAEIISLGHASDTAVLPILPSVPFVSRAILARCMIHSSKVSSANS